MPEGVEVKLTSEELNKFSTSYLLSNIKIIGGRYLRHGNPTGFDTFKKYLPLKLDKIESKGKGIFFVFEQEFYIYNTLGMTGHWSTKKDKYSVIQLTLSKNWKIKNSNLNLTENKSLYFRDIRNFGTIKFLMNRDDYLKEYNKLGPDMLDINTTFDIFSNRINKYKHKNITQILMSQNIISGVGNYIKAEALYRSKISPHHILIDLSNNQIQKLYQEIKNVMLESYSLQGNSFNTYRNFQSGGGNFYTMLKVYGRDYDPLGNKVIHEKTLDGRTTHWVHEIQT